MLLLVEVGLGEEATMEQLEDEPDETFCGGEKGQCTQLVSWLRSKGPSICICYLKGKSRGKRRIIVQMRRVMVVGMLLVLIAAARKS